MYRRGDVTEGEAAVVEHVPFEHLFERVAIGQHRLCAFTPFSSGSRGQMIIPFQDLARASRHDSHSWFATIQNLEGFPLADLFLDLRPMCLHIAY